LFRRFGIAIALLVGATTIFLQGMPVAIDILNGAGGGWNTQLAVLFTTCALVFYFNAHYVRYRWEELFDERFANIGLVTQSWMATLLVAAFNWFRFHDDRTAVLWVGLALLLAFLGNQFKLREFWLQAHVLTVVSIVRVVAVNLQSDAVYRFGLSGR